MNKKTGRPFIIQSKRYRAYEKECLKQIPEEARIGIDEAVEITCIYYRETKRRVDLTNLLEATDDILVRAGVIKDDNSRIISSHDGSRVFHDKGNPRVEITIQKMEDR